MYPTSCGSFLEYIYVKHNTVSIICMFDLLLYMVNSRDCVQIVIYPSHTVASLQEADYHLLVHISLTINLIVFNNQQNMKNEHSNILMTNSSWRLLNEFEVQQVELGFTSTRIRDATDKLTEHSLTQLLPAPVGP